MVVLRLFINLIIIANLSIASIPRCGYLSIFLQGIISPLTDIHVLTSSCHDHEEDDINLMPEGMKDQDFLSHELFCPCELLKYTATMFYIAFSIQFTPIMHSLEIPIHYYINQLYLNSYPELDSPPPRYH